MQSWPGRIITQLERNGSLIRGFWEPKLAVLWPWHVYWTVSKKKRNFHNLSIYPGFYEAATADTLSMIGRMAYKRDNDNHYHNESNIQAKVPGIDGGELVVLFSTLLSPVDKWFQMEIIHPPLVLLLPAGRGNFQTIKSDRTHYKWSSAIRQSCCSSIEKSLLSYVDDNNQMADRTTICNSWQYPWLNS